MKVVKKQNLVEVLAMYVPYKPGTYGRRTNGFLEIVHAFVQEVSMHVCVCVCPRPQAIRNNSREMKSDNRLDKLYCFPVSL